MNLFIYVCSKITCNTDMGGKINFYCRLPVLQINDSRKHFMYFEASLEEDHRKFLFQ